MLFNCQRSERSTRFLKIVSGLKPISTSIQCPSKPQRLYLGNEKQHISKNRRFSTQNQKRPEQVKNTAEFVNQLILGKYTEILVCCGCDVSLVGLFRIADSGLSIKIRFTAAMFALKFL